jgi:hypothetical protein
MIVLAEAGELADNLGDTVFGAWAGQAVLLRQPKVPVNRSCLLRISIH